MSDVQEQKESSQWQRVPESLLDLKDGHYFMYGKIKNEYKRGWPHHDNDYEIIHVIKALRTFKQISISLPTGIIPSHGNISITPEYYMDAEKWKWPEPPKEMPDNDFPWHEVLNKTRAYILSIINDSVSNPAWNQVTEQAWFEVLNQVMDPVLNNVNNLVNDLNWDKVRDYVSDKVKAQIIDCVCNNVIKQVKSHIINHAINQISPSVREQVMPDLKAEILDYGIGPINKQLRDKVIDRAYAQIKYKYDENELSHYVVDYVYDYVKTQVSNQVKKNLDKIT